MTVQNEILSQWRHSSSHNENGDPVPIATFFIPYFILEPHEFKKKETVIIKNVE
jgi:hypothetical protein